MSEPVTVHTERFVRCRWTPTDLAYSRHYPAVSWSASFSGRRATGAAHAAAGDIDWAAHRGRVLALLNESDRLAALTELVGVTALADSERIELPAVGCCAKRCCSRTP